MYHVYNVMYILFMFTIEHYNLELNDVNLRRINKEKFFYEQRISTSIIYYSCEQSLNYLNSDHNSSCRVLSSIYKNCM